MPLAPLLAHLRAQPSRTWSIVITVYGDAILPRGGAVWLGTLLALFAAFDIGEGVVRTAMSRLAADGWVARTRNGRHSFYRLSAKGQAVFAQAAETIYRRPAPAWDGGFRLVLGDAAEGLTPLAPGVWIAPTSGGEASLPREAIVLQATTDPDGARRLAARAWPLARTADAYARFLATFAPLAETAAGLGARDAMAARTLLIHDWRRIVLRDPRLPLALLSPDWPGGPAYDLCAAIYAALLPASERWLDAHASDEAGPLRPAALADRFAN